MPILERYARPTQLWPWTIGRRWRSRSSASEGWPSWRTCSRRRGRKRESEAKAAARKEKKKRQADGGWYTPQQKKANLSDAEQKAVEQRSEEKKEDNRPPLQRKQYGGDSKDVPKVTDSWKGGPGAHGALRESKSAKTSMEQQVFVGGMRNPAVVVKGLPVLQNLGVRVFAAWERFFKSNPKAGEVAELYGSLDCAFDEKLVEAWKAELRKLVGAKGSPAVKLKGTYVSPLDPEIISAWAAKGNDPETEVQQWIRTGAPLGMEVPIGTCGIFPPALKGGRTDPSLWADADEQLRGGSITNYKSVTLQEADAKKELDRYHSKGYSIHISEERLKEEFKDGTISRLGLVTKLKEDGQVKHRIVVDLRRSGGNDKSSLPERLILPRPWDAVHSIRSIYNAGLEASSEPQMELAVIDVTDAFMSLAVDSREWKHCIAPYTTEGEYVVFVALLFGFKTAPLLWSRVAAMISRFLQSAIPEKEAEHQSYLDDSLWALAGPLRRRNCLLAFILMTMKALGLNLSLGKGARASSVTWIGVKYSILQKGILAVTLPQKFMDSLLGELDSWAGRGMAPLRELRQVCGRMAWLSGVLPRTRWTITVLYGVLHAREDEVSTGAEESRRQQRSDSRNKEGLFVVKRLEMVRLWLCLYLKTAQGAPIRRVHLRASTAPAVKITTDASPEGLGAMLFVNGVALAALSSPVTKEDAKQLNFEFGASSCQAIVETLALVVALKHWRSRLTSGHLTLVFQSDSMAALALSQKLRGSGGAMNFLGCELSILMEDLQIDEIFTTHIPGVANKLCDWLSRPSKWEHESLPSELTELPLDSIGGRPCEWYLMPTPFHRPEMWGVEDHAVSAWDNIRGL